MRYLHDQVDEIVRHVASAGLTITKCDRSARRPSSKVSKTELAEMLNASKKLWGALHPDFLWLSSSPKEGAFTLNQAVAEVEAASALNEFLLVGYEDGGVISRSNSRLAFQAEARSANWWRAESSIPGKPVIVAS
jgi:hypothetical protein